MKRITVKIGSTFFIDDDGNLNLRQLAELSEQIRNISDSGIEVCLVSSGAIAVGRKKVGLNKRPKDIAKLQALAAIGQTSLMQIYEQVFEIFNLRPAQILVSHDDFTDRHRNESLKNAVNELFKFGAIPVVNENDAVAVQEIKFGDNDTLSAMMAKLTQSELLILVSDVDGLYTADPNTDRSAKLIPEIDVIDDSIEKLSGVPSSAYGTGGMQTKIGAAKIATEAGIPMMIISARKIAELSAATCGVNLGTYFKAAK